VRYAKLPRQAPETSTCRLLARAQHLALFLDLVTEEMEREDLAVLAERVSQFEARERMLLVLKLWLMLIAN
jgi:DnaJ-domain-containing protein 1